MTQTSTARRIAWWSLLSMVFLVPIVMSGFKLPGLEEDLSFGSLNLVKLSAIVTLTLVSLAAWAADLLRHGGVVRRTPLDWLVLAWVGWAGLTTVTAIHWPTALLGAEGRWEGLVTFAVYAILYFLALQFMGEEGRTLRLAQVLFCSGLVVAVYGLLQYAGVVLVPDDLPWDETNRAFSTYGNPNMLGGFLIFPLIISLGLALRERSSWFRLLYWLGFGLNAFALLVTFTRGAWIGGFAGTVLLGVIAWRQRAKMRLLDLAPAGVFVGAGVAIIVRSLSSSQEVTNVLSRLGSLFDGGTGSGQTRTEIWQAAASMIKERPLLGWGAETFGLMFQKFKPAEYVRDAGAASTADNVHNYPLHLAAGLGILGALLFYAIWIWAGIRSFRVVFGRVTGASSLLVGAFWAAAAAYLLHLVFGISVPSSSFLLWIALAVVLAPTARAVTVPARRFGTVITAIVTLVALLCVAGQGVLLAADRYHAIASEEFSRRALPERITAADRAVALNPLVPAHRSTAARLRTEQMRADAAALARAERQGVDTSTQIEALSSSFEEAEAAYLEAIDFTPNGDSEYVDLTTVYNLAGAAVDPTYYQDAIDTAYRGLEVMPLDVFLRERLADAYVATGRTNEAIEALEYCLELDAGATTTALMLAKLYQEEGMVDEAIAVLEAAEARVPGHPLLISAIEVLRKGEPLP